MYIHQKNVVVVVCNAIDSWNNGNNLTHRNQAIDSMAHVNWHRCIYKSRAVVVTATRLMNEWCVGE